MLTTNGCGTGDFNTDRTQLVDLTLINCILALVAQSGWHRQGREARVFFLRNVLLLI